MYYYYYYSPQICDDFLPCHTGRKGAILLINRSHHSQCCSSLCRCCVGGEVSPCPDRARPDHCLSTSPHPGAAEVPFCCTSQSHALAASARLNPATYRSPCSVSGLCYYISSRPGSLPCPQRMTHTCRLLDRSE